MDHFTIKYAIVAMLFFLMIAKYDIHMFQLASYRNSRYFRWLFPSNIIGIKRLFAVIMLIGYLVLLFNKKKRARAAAAVSAE